MKASFRAVSFFVEISFRISFDNFFLIRIKQNYNKGLDRGVQGLCLGAKATIAIPPALAYGDKGSIDFDIPPGAALHLDAEIVEVETEKPDPGNLFIAMDIDESRYLSKEEVERYMEIVLGRKHIPEGFWEAQDKDGDGLISWDEFTGPKGDEPPKYLNAFEIVDVNKSGYLSRDELEAFAQRVHGKSVPDSVWRREDKDGDGFISWNGFAVVS